MQTPSGAPTTKFETVDLPVSGMTCASCVRHVERALRKVPGVTSANVNLATERATVSFDPSTTELEVMRAAVEDAGYELKLPAPAPPIDAAPERAEAPVEDARGSDLARARRDLWVAAAFTVPLVVGSMVPMAWPAWHHTHPAVAHFFMGWGGLLLATPVQFWAGRRFLRTCLGELRHRTLGMSTLVALGSGAAYAYSLAALLVPAVFPAGTAHTYFEASASIVTLVLVGKYLESLARGRATRAMTDLLALEPRRSTVRRGGRELEVDIREVRVDDHVVVRPGERIAVDGVVIEGEGHVDQSPITGEPMPVEKGPGDQVVSGSVNGARSFVFRATRVGSDTVLQQVVRFVQQAQGSKPAIQQLADRVAAVFVPVVLGLSALTFAVWTALALAGVARGEGNFALVAAVSVIVIACPCAMGLATPTAIMVGTGRAAELGVLFRHGVALERLADVDAVLIDKTGTLTEGRPSVARVHTFGAKSLDPLRLVAAAEARSEHPVARAIVLAAQQRGLSLPPVDEVHAVAGFGLEARVEGKALHVGTARYFDQLGISTTPATAEHATFVDPTDGASTPEVPSSQVFAALDRTLVAVFDVVDRPKPSSRSAVTDLKRLGLHVAMVTGDARSASEAVQRELGIDALFAEQLPTDKGSRVRELQQSGRRVAFVGDGINDAPAMAQADGGVAMGTGTGIAIETGDVILMRGDVAALVDAFAVSRRVVRTIRQNFVWAYGYNVVLIPVAAGVLYPLFGVLLSPVLAAAAMGASSLFVVGNSLRLRRYEAPTGGSTR